MADTTVSEQPYHRQQVQSNDQTRAEHIQPTAEPRSEDIAPMPRDGATFRHTANEDPTPPRNESAAAPPEQRNGNVATATMSSARTRKPAEEAVTPAGCACQGNQRPAQSVFALGSLNFDFGTEVRRDYFVSTYGDELPVVTLEGMHQLLTRRIGNAPPDSWLSEKIIWTLTHDETPIYAIQPSSAFAHEAYTILIQMLGEQCKAPEAVPERVSIAGTLNGSVTLLTGQIVPVICPDMRAVFNWRIQDLIDQFTRGMAEDQAAKLSERISRVFLRLYYDYQNLGISAPDRALNYSVTVATNIARAIEETIKDSEKNYELDSVTTEKSPVCRPESDCWDVKLVFFDSNQPWQSLRLVFKFAVDVSDVVPVAVGAPRKWYIR